MSKVLAIDYGTKHIGLAISDDGRKVALPFHTIKVRGDIESDKTKIFGDLANLISVEGIGLVVIGMPLNATGGRTKLGDQVFEFTKGLGDEVSVPIEVIDERFTSKMAAQLPHKTSRNIHELSAQIILQDYLDKIQILKSQ